jgi:hypothetical protein
MQAMLARRSRRTGAHQQVDPGGKASGELSQGQTRRHAGMATKTCLAPRSCELREPGDPFRAECREDAKNKERGNRDKKSSWRQVESTRRNHARREQTCREEQRHEPPGPQRLARPKSSRSVQNPDPSWFAIEEEVYQERRR